MSANTDRGAVVGVVVAACAACCAGPILGVLTAIGIRTGAGVERFGVLTLVAAAGIVAVLVARRRLRTCAGGTLRTARRSTSMPVCCQSDGAD